MLILAAIGGALAGGAVVLLVVRAATRAAMANFWNGYR